jgi:hypothetical protein
MFRHVTETVRVTVTRWKQITLGEKYIVQWHVVGIISSSYYVVK